jgi:hypothetical protein
MKLSLEALKEKSEDVASEQLLNEIAGGYVADCHSGFAVAWGTWLFETGFGR